MAFGGKKAELFYPKINTVQEYDLGKQSGMVEQFLLLGFGTTGKELAANYGVKLVGEETVGGQKAYHLELKPKTSTMREKLTKLDFGKLADADTHEATSVGPRLIESYSDIRI